MIAFVIHKPSAVVEHGFQQGAITQSAKGHVRADWQSRLVAARKPVRSVRVRQELRIIEALCRLGTERAVGVGRQGCERVVEFVILEAIVVIGEEKRWC